MAGLEPLVVFWTGWGIHFMVVVSFMVQVTLLLLSDIRRRKGWAGLKVVIWSAYMLADMTALYALGHMSVVCRSPEHHLMALWAPLLLVHLGGQDNISAYAIEDNRLWLRHLQTFVGQVAATVYVLYVSSILTHPSSSKLRSAAILMFVVGVLKYGERIWALKRADSCASSSLSATSYDKLCRTDRQNARTGFLPTDMRWILSLDIVDESIDFLDDVYALLDVPKQMFEGPTSYVQISNVGDKVHKGGYMSEVVEVQLSMMYDLLYTKAVVVHTWYGLVSRVISLPFTVTALKLFHSSLLGGKDDDAAAADYTRVDVAITNVLLTGAVVLETMSVLKAIFSRWTAVLLLEKGRYILASVVFALELFITAVMGILFRSQLCWSGRMHQHSIFELASHSGISTRSKMAKRMGMEDWWDSNVYSWSTKVPELVIPKVLQLDSTTSQGLNAVQRGMNKKNETNNGDRLVTFIWTEEELKLEERILVWHIATHVYIEWYEQHGTRMWNIDSRIDIVKAKAAAEALANYMFFLLAARPYMLPYPVSRQPYVRLCTDFPRDCDAADLLNAILKQKEALMQGTPLQLDEGIGPETDHGAQPQPSMNSILDRGCQLAAKLIHITATAPPKEKKKESTASRRRKQRQQREERVDGNEDIITGQTETFSVNNGEVVLNELQFEDVLNMVLEVWVEMLCYTANLCNENYHAKHLTDGGEIMTIIALLMIYMKNGLIHKDTSTSAVV